MQNIKIKSRDGRKSLTYSEYVKLISALFNKHFGDPDKILNAMKSIDNSLEILNVYYDSYDSSDGMVRKFIRIIFKTPVESIKLREIIKKFRYKIITTLQQELKDFPISVSFFTEIKPNKTKEVVISVNIP